MTPDEESRAEKLLGLARERFSPELRAVEEQIVRHSCGFADPGEGGPELVWHTSGQEAGLDGNRTGLLGPYVGPGNRPLPGWPGPEARAGFLRWLLLDGEAGALLDPRGLRVWGARLTEPLNLTRCRVNVVVEFQSCVLEKGLAVNWGQLRELRVVNSTVLAGCDAAGSQFQGSVFLQNSVFEEVSFQAATIQGQLGMEGSRVAGAMSFGGAVVTGNALLNGGFECDGFFDFSVGQVGAQLNMIGAKLNAEGPALNMDGTSVGQSVYLNEVQCPGQVNMVGARVGKMVYCVGSEIGRLRAEALEANQVMWTEIPEPHVAEISLRLAKIQTLLVDESSLAATWVIRLNHLQMQALTDSGGRLLTAEECRAWLDLQPPQEWAEAQPWMQLSRMQEAAGDRRGARRLVYELRVRQNRVRWQGEGLGAKTLRGMAAGFARLEEQPFRILWPLGFLLLLGTLVFHGYRAHFAETGEAAYRATHTVCAVGAVQVDAARGGAVGVVAGQPRQNSNGAPAGLRVGAEAAQGCAVGAAYPRFSSFVYTLENTLPVVKLGQDAAWAPRAEADGGWGIYWVLAGLRWFLILSGWAMGIILGAAITARFRS